MIDNLSYTYAGATSLLSSVSDASNNLRGFKGDASSYGYDPTGNLISDPQKGIADIAYTYNDLPLKITSAKGTIENFYTSAGEKLKSIMSPTNQELNAGPVTRVYLGGAEYVDGELEAVYTNEGRVVISKDGNYPEYYLKDHLGNTRVRIADKNLDNLVYIDPNDPENDELMSTHHYYPFGMEWDTPALDVSGNDLGETGVDSRYTYNGKEDIDDLGINLLEFETRWYDPAIGRFIGVDVIADQIPNLSGYNFASNNPITNIDLYGMQGVNSNSLDDFYDDYKENGLISAVSNYFNVGSLVSGTSSEKGETVSKINQTSETASNIVTLDSDTKESISEFGGDLVHYGESMQDVGGDAVLSSAAMAATPASPASPMVATAGGITSSIGTGMVLAGDILEDGKLSKSTAKNTVISVATSSLGNKIKQTINKTNILGKSGNNPVSNILKSSTDVIKLKTEGVLKDKN